MTTLRERSCDGRGVRRRQSPILFSHAFSPPPLKKKTPPAAQESVRPTHLKPESFRQKLAHAGIQLVRTTFDAVTLYNPKGPNPESRWLRRMLFLETVAGVPGEEEFLFFFAFCSGVFYEARERRRGREREREREGEREQAKGQSEL